MRFVNNILPFLAAFPLVVGVASCDRHDEASITDAGVALDRVERVDRNVGEGEREWSPQAVSDEYRAEIDGDVHLADAAGDTRLVAEHDGDLVLKGSVPTLELKHALEVYATLLADRPVKNELEEKQELPRLDGSVRPRD